MVRGTMRLWQYVSRWTQGGWCDMSLLLDSPGWWGWTGWGGHYIVFNPRLKLAVGVAITGMRHDCMLEERIKPIIAALVSYISVTLGSHSGHTRVTLGSHSGHTRAHAAPPCGCAPGARPVKCYPELQAKLQDKSPAGLEHSELPG
eukprot:12516-Pyramimonas_sp.AAC.1